MESLELPALPQPALPQPALPPTSRQILRDAKTSFFQENGSDHGRNLVTLRLKPRILNPSLLIRVSSVFHPRFICGQKIRTCACTIELT